jgi:hypothetical protein
LNTTALNVEIPQSMPPRHAAARTVIGLKPDLFRPGFSAWLADNWGLYAAFEREANLVAATGRKHWGANTIIEYLRHETALRDVNGEFKFNDRWTSSIARLYAVMNPRNAELFEYRVRAGGVVRRAA